VNSGDGDAITWYHWNEHNTTYFNDTMLQQAIDVAQHPALIDPFTHRAFGGEVAGVGLHALVGSNGLKLSTHRATPETSNGSGKSKKEGKAEKAETERNNGSPGAPLEVTIKVLTIPDTTPNEWLAEITRLIPVPALQPIQGVSLVDCERGGTTWGDGAACGTTWSELLERSYIQVDEINSSDMHNDPDHLNTRTSTIARTSTDLNASTSTSTDDPFNLLQPVNEPARSAATNITVHAVWDRYLSLIQGRSSYAPIKFNGQVARCSS
jgi:hypothetical protein